MLYNWTLKSVKGENILKDIILIITAVIFLYLGFSTIIDDPKYVGKFGHAFSLSNKEYFGYIAFVYLFLLLYPLYKIYKKPIFNKKSFETLVAYLLLLFSFLIFQALVVDDLYKGKIGNLIVSSIKPYIGIAGAWLFWFVTFSISLILLFDKRVEEFFAKYKKTTSRFERELPKTVKTKSVEKVSSKDKKVNKNEKIVIPNNPIEADNSETIETKSDEEERKTDTFKEPSLITDIVKTEIVDELEENKKLLETVEKGSLEKPKNFKLPTLDFLEKPQKKRSSINEAEIDKKIKELIEKLAKFKIEGDVVRTYTGPVVTTFEFKPAPHIKVSKILNLQDDLAMALKAKTIRIQAPVPGKDVVGIEIPNKEIETIYLREILESDIFKNAASPLTIALGKDIVGKSFVTDLKKLPHLLIAGTTGSGKSVGINSIIVSLLYRNSPDNLKLMLIDPKMLEFSIYNDIPHLLTPVITKSKQAITALNNMVAEMERRYQLMSKTKTKNIESYNKKAKKEGFEPLPYIVVTIDELADLMMTSGKEVEYSIARLAQMARASGIHLIVATQRPSVDVVTGLIKANLPSRISFKVGQKIDSKVILDTFGAESLLGRGDMLFTPPGITGLIRLHAPWISENEIENIVEFLKVQREPEYDEKFLKEEIGSNGNTNEIDEELDELYEEAKEIVLKERKTSISYLQRRLQIGYNRAARIVEQLENTGVLSPPNSKGNREIII
ncbi:DNA translocase FtsK [Nitrosophilus labii]|uniref:DNA translocase FtsK n=1 Tax=Nitrosophilus labii TaxID=2706014 RepID=UPI001FE87D89|nr:DNA translocase FtsK [Nitrosophilus labii]